MLAEQQRCCFYEKCYVFQGWSWSGPGLLKKFFHLEKIVYFHVRVSLHQAETQSSQGTPHELDHPDSNHCQARLRTGDAVSECTCRAPSLESPKFSSHQCSSADLEYPHSTGPNVFLKLRSLLLTAKLADGSRFSLAAGTKLA